MRGIKRKKKEREKENTMEKGIVLPPFYLSIYLKPPKVRVHTRNRKRVFFFGLFGWLLKEEEEEEEEDVFPRKSRMWSGMDG